MKVKTFILLFLLSQSALIISSCGSSKPDKNPSTVAEAEEQLAKNRKKEAKANKKANKEAHKRHWDLQTKEAKKSIKRNKKRHRKNNKNKRIVP